MNAFSGVKQFLKEQDELEKRKQEILRLMHENAELKKELSEMYTKERRYLTNHITK